MKRDFSDASREKLLNLVTQVENEKWCDFTDWIGDRWYDFESWIGSLNIKNYINDVNAYHKKVIDKNNTSKQNINKIFDDVKAVDTSYGVRMSSCNTQLEQINNLIKSLCAIISPSYGRFDAGEINASLGDIFEEYQQTGVILDKLSTEGLSEEDFEGMDSTAVNSILSRVVSGVIDVMPNVNIGEKMEVPIGPGMVAYYSVAGEVDTGSDMDVEISTVIEEQRLLFRKMALSSSIGEVIRIGGMVNSEGDGSLFIKSDGSDVAVNMDGSVTGSASYKAGNMTYTIQSTCNLQKFVFEESVKSDLSSGSVTSTIGIEKSYNNNWTPVPVPVPVYEPVPFELPKLELSAEDWATIAVAGTVILVVAGIALAPCTGGTSLVLCAV